MSFEATRKAHSDSQVDLTVIGAGAIGLAIGREFVLQGWNVMVLEQEQAIAAHTSSHNSQVIHRGFNHPPHFLKSRLCIEGRGLLVNYCAPHNITVNNVGKLVIATDETELPKLDRLLKHAEEAGITDLVPLPDKDAIHDLEPNVKGIRGFYSPNTSVFDAASYADSLRQDIEKNGGVVATGYRVIGGEVINGGDALILNYEYGPEHRADEIETRNVINAAGLFAQAVTHSIKGIPNELIPKQHFAKGHYYDFNGHEKIVSHLVYPTPVDGGLGTHVTISHDGESIRFGPDVAWLKEQDPYKLNYRHHGTPEEQQVRVESFYRNIRRYYDLPDDSLVEGQVGIRPKLSGQGQPEADFLIRNLKGSGIPAWTELYGIESPALTASLSIAQYVWNLVQN